MPPAKADWSSKWLTKKKPRRSPTLRLKQLRLRPKLRPRPLLRQMLLPPKRLLPSSSARKVADRVAAVAAVAAVDVTIVAVAVVAVTTVVADVAATMTAAKS